MSLQVAASNPGMVQPEPGADPLPPGLREDFVGARAGALLDYVARSDFGVIDTEVERISL